MKITLLCTNHSLKLLYIYIYKLLLLIGALQEKKGIAIWNQRRHAINILADAGRWQNTREHSFDTWHSQLAGASHTDSLTIARQSPPPAAPHASSHHIILDIGRVRPRTINSLYVTTYIPPYTFIYLHLCAASVANMSKMQQKKHTQTNTWKLLIEMRRFLIVRYIRCATYSIYIFSIYYNLV